LFYDHSDQNFRTTNITLTKKEVRGFHYNFLANRQPLYYSFHLNPHSRHQRGNSGQIPFMHAKKKAQHRTEKPTLRRFGRVPYQKIKPQRNTHNKILAHPSQSPDLPDPRFKRLSSKLDSALNKRQ
jgi:hypothetical protein